LVSGQKRGQRDHDGFDTVDGQEVTCRASDGVVHADLASKDRHRQVNGFWGGGFV
jgi:hypothetical protein